MLVKVCNYGKVVSTYQSDKSIRLIVGRADPYSFVYVQETDSLELHMTRERYPLPDLLTINVGTTNRIPPS